MPCSTLDCRSRATRRTCSSSRSSSRNSMSYHGTIPHRATNHVARFFRFTPLYGTTWRDLAFVYAGVMAGCNYCHISSGMDVAWNSHHSLWSRINGESCNRIIGPTTWTQVSFNGAACWAQRLNICRISPVRFVSLLCLQSCDFSTAS